MASTNKTNRKKQQPIFSPVAIDNIIKKIDKQIAAGEQLIKNRPIAPDSFENWESGTCKILKKSAPIDPLSLDRFQECGLHGDELKKSNETFRETRQAMTLYDKIRILDYHIGMLKREKKDIH